MRGAVALLAVALLAGCAPDCTPRTGSDAPIILLVTVDTLRADHVDGPTRRARTPHLDRLAAEGVRFTRAYAAANVTVPSHLSLLTSRPMAAHRATTNHAQSAVAFETLPARLAASGYRTAAFVSALHLGRTMLLGRLLPELERFDGPRRASEPWRAEETVDRLLPWLRDACRGPAFAWVHLWDPHMPYAPPAPFDRTYYEGDPRDPAHGSLRDAQLDWVLYDLTRLRAELKRRPALLRRIKRAFRVGNRTARQMVLYPNLLLSPPAAPDEQAMLFAAARGIHPDLRDRLPYNTRIADFLTGVRDLEYPRALYAGEVSYVDREIGRLRETLETWGLADRTVLVVTADHGEGLGDHGIYFNHVGLWEEMVEVPLIVWAPGRLAPAVRPELVSGLDVAPTLLGFAGVTPPPSMEGRDLFAGAVEPRPIVVEAAKGAQIMLRDGAWKLVRTLDWVWVNDAFHRRPGEIELYELTSDDGERTNRHGSDPATAAALAVRLDAWMIAHGLAPDGSGYRGPAPPVSRADAERLRALGYVE
jgi:arylsulfatase A-like enzyme